MQTLFAAEEVFHSETSKVFSELEAVVDKLAKEVQKGTLPRRTFPKPQPITNSVISSHNNSSQNSTLNPPKASNGHSSVRGKYSGGYTPTKDYEPVGGDRNSDVNSSRLNGNTRPDMDQLSFEVGELIDVMEYDDPEEQEEGWLCGAKE